MLCPSCRRQLDAGLGNDPPAPGTLFVIVEAAAQEMSQITDAARMPRPGSRLDVQLPVDDLALQVLGQGLELRPQFGQAGFGDARDHDA